MIIMGALDNVACPIVEHCQHCRFNNKELDIFVLNDMGLDNFVFNDKGLDIFVFNDNSDNG